MNPVIGLDVSKESLVQAFLDKGKPYHKSFYIKNESKIYTIRLSFGMNFVDSDKENETS
jgi:transposase